MKRRDGFSIAEVLIVVIVVIIIGAIGWLAYTNVLAPKSADNASQNTSNGTEQVTVDKESDLYKADKMLDDVNFEDSDSTELDKAVDEF